MWRVAANKLNNHRHLTRGISPTWQLGREVTGFTRMDLGIDGDNIKTNLKNGV
jgi:hypothetical protein